MLPVLVGPGVDNANSWAHMLVRHDLILLSAPVPRTFDAPVDGTPLSLHVGFLVPSASATTGIERRPVNFRLS